MGHNAVQGPSEIGQLIIVGTFTGLLQGSSHYPGSTSHSQTHRYANSPASAGSQNPNHAHHCQNNGGIPLNTSVDWQQNLDSLKESMKLASSYNWSDLDFSQFQGTKKCLMESMKAVDSLNPEQFADLASSLNNFFTKITNEQQHQVPFSSQESHASSSTVTMYTKSEMGELGQSAGSDFSNCTNSAQGSTMTGSASSVHQYQVPQSPSMNRQQPAITVGSPYPQQNIPVGTNSSSGSYTHVPEEIDDDFNWDKLL